MCNVHYFCALVRSRRPPKKCEVRWRNEERNSLSHVNSPSIFGKPQPPHPSLFFSLQRIGKARVVEVIKKPIFLSLLMVHKAHITREKKATRLRHANSHIGFSFFKKVKKKTVWRIGKLRAACKWSLKREIFCFFFCFLSAGPWRVDRSRQESWKFATNFNLRVSFFIISLGNKSTWQ